MSAPHTDRDHSEQPTQPEAFVELLPPDVGHNLRHLGPERAHVTGEECHCGPERIPHAEPGTSRGKSARVVRASETQVEAASMALYAHDPERLVCMDDHDGHCCACGRHGIPHEESHFPRAVADAVVAAGPDADEVTRLRAEVEHWKHHAWEAGEGFKRAIEDAARAGARRRAAEAERDRLAGVVERVRALAKDLRARSDNTKIGRLMQVSADMIDRAILDADAPEASEAKCTTCGGAPTDPACVKSPDGALSGHTFHGGVEPGDA